MADGKISSMFRATETKTTDLFEISQEVGGPGSERVTRANDLQSIALFLHEVIQNNALTTTEKTLVNAINELANGSKYKTGDRIELPQSSTCFSGYITHNNDRIYLTIPLAKEVADGVSVSIEGSFIVRSVVGYPNGQSSQGVIDASQITSKSIYGNMLCIFFQFDSAFFPTSGQNALASNTPVSISVTANSSTNNKLIIKFD